MYTHISNIRERSRREKERKKERETKQIIYVHTECKLVYTSSRLHYVLYNAQLHCIRCLINRICILWFSQFWKKRCAWKYAKQQGYNHDGGMIVDFLALFVIVFHFSLVVFFFFCTWVTLCYVSKYIIVLYVSLSRSSNVTYFRDIEIFLIFI